MIIRILQDNAVHAIYQDNRGSEVINSTHAGKAQHPLVQSLAEALPFKGAMEFNPDVPDIVFDTKSYEIRYGDQRIVPSHLDENGQWQDTDLTIYPATVQIFANIVWGYTVTYNGQQVQKYRRLWQIKQEKENAQSN